MRRSTALMLTIVVTWSAAGCARSGSVGAAAPRTAARAAVPEPVGSYEFTITSADRSESTTGTMLIEGSAGAYQGLIRSPGLPEEVPIRSVVVEGRQMTVIGTTPVGPLTLQLTFSGDTAFSGRWSLGPDSGELQGRKKGAPESAASEAAGARGEVKAGAAAPAAVAEEVGQERITELVRLVNSGDRAAARSYVQENYAPPFLRIPLDRHLNFISELHDRTRGLEVHDVEVAGPAEVRARVQSRLIGQWETLMLRLEPDPPHRIASIGLAPADPPAGAHAARRLSDAEMVAELEAFLQKLAGADLFSGVVLLAREGQPLFLQAYGEANKDFGVPNRVDTRFNLGSMNKMFTAVAIAQLVERGKLSFDDPLSKFLPDFPTPEAAQQIQIKHLLTHTSGLGSYFNREFQRSSRARFRTVDDFLELARSEPLAFEPGTRWHYSNTGFLVLGKVIEQVTGQSYHDYVRENIYRPAGMTSTGEYELDRVNPNLAVGYQKEFTDEGAYFRNNLFEHVIRGGPAGGGYSTAEDLLRFAEALRSGKLVGRRYVELLTTPKPELNSPRYGFGFGVDPQLGTVGHTGGFIGVSSSLDIFPGSGYTAVVLSNYGGAGEPVAVKLQELVRAARN